MITAEIEADRSIIWIASYPKSGSTWLRSLLTAYLNPDEPLDLNALIGGPTALQRQGLDDHAAIDSGELSPDELIPYRAQWHCELARTAGNTRLIKTHNAYTASTNGVTLFPKAASAGVIYVVRDPVDVVPSFAHHEGRDFDWTIRHMNDPAAAMNVWPDKSGMMLPEHLSSWSSNVEGWTTQTEIPMHLLRYEDLHTDTEKAFSDVLRFCAIPVNRDLVNESVTACQIGRLQVKEQKLGFTESPSSKRRFFRSGNVGDGQAVLSEKQKNALVRNNRSTMAKLGYETA